ncbi:50S ribosomal protein L24 [Patescibacteria group bacterium]|nr:50S ribosomal protein L24 [Patescibacteria group bacterium]
MKLKKGDNIVVITGKNKGKTGKIVKLLPKKDRVVVEGVNKVTRHVKKTPQKPGQKVEFEAPMHISNVMLMDPESKKRTRVGYKVEKTDKGTKKTRISKKTNKVI